MPLDELDKVYLNRALELAESGRGLTTPNPMVGAVIVSDGRIVGEGYHAAAGEDHAEIAAIKDAARRLPPSGLRGATLYVTLEPCCVFGRTPPCVPTVVDAGFARVVVGAVDPSLAVSGRGIRQLVDAGIRVDVAEGEPSRRCRRQNDGFRKAVTTGLPFVTYKYAMTLDGRIATDSGDSRWISSAEGRLAVHRMRSWMDAVVVGSGTLHADDPTLTARGVPCRRQPLRVVVDTNLALGSDSSLVRTVREGPVVAVCGLGVSQERREEVESWGVEVVCVPEADDRRPAPLEVLRRLGSMGVQNLLLEGGPTLAGAWWQAGVIDRVIAFVSTRVLSGSVLRSPLRGAGSRTVAEGTALLETEIVSVGADISVSGYVGEAY